MGRKGKVFGRYMGKKDIKSLFLSFLGQIFRPVRRRIAEWQHQGSFFSYIPIGQLCCFTIIAPLANVPARVGGIKNHPASVDQ